MKHLLIILTAVLVLGCRDSASKDNSPKLPPETQAGANAFGVTINGKVYIPRDPTGVSVGTTAKGMIFWRSPDDQHIYDELENQRWRKFDGFSNDYSFTKFISNGSRTIYVRKK